MALSERSRSALYQGFSNVVDEEAVQEMLSFFPARDVEEPVTKEFLRAEVGHVRMDLANLRAEFADLKTEFADLKTEFADLKTEFADLKTEFADLRADFSEHQNQVDTRISQLELKVGSEMRRFMWMNLTALTAFASVIIAAVKI